MVLFNPSSRLTVGFQSSIFIPFEGLQTNLPASPGLIFHVKLGSIFAPIILMINLARVAISVSIPVPIFIA